jgi:hypothetical protein
MKRILGCITTLGVLMALLAGCSSSGMGVTITGDTHQATASDVSCVAGFNSVTVRGSFTAAPGIVVAGRGPVPTFKMPDGRVVRPSLQPPSVVPSAVILDSAGHELGNFNGPYVTVQNKARPFRFVVPVEAGSPASCDVTWTAGPAPVIGE